MAKNTQEKPQTFEEFKGHVRNWDISECIILEMWEEQKAANPNDLDEVRKYDELNRQEKNFQKMLVNNMESVFKIFFRGMNTIKVKRGTDDAGIGKVESQLTELENKRIV